MKVELDQVKMEKAIVTRLTVDGPQYLASPGIWDSDIVNAQIMSIAEAQYAAFHESTKGHPARAIPLLRGTNKAGVQSG